MMTQVKVDALEVRVYDRASAMASGAAQLAAERLREVLGRQTGAAVILASAASQVLFLEELVAAQGIDWQRVTLFHMDEYLGITGEHPASFSRFVRERVVARVRPKCFYVLRGDADQPIRECDRYEALLTAQPIDLCCLGIGENGHVAFNDPPVADFEDARLVKLVKLDEACRRQQVGEGAFPTLASVPEYAYTLTVPALCAAGRMICVVPELRKAEAVRNTLSGPISEKCPASMLRRQGHAVLFLDRDSASLWRASGGEARDGG
jgi:glucosamine-6-phosphate deaminase